MKKLFSAVCGVLLALSFAGSPVRAQTGAVTKGPNSSVLKDMEEEKSAAHELQVARHYFKMKKAYLAAYKRADELIAGYPQFSRLDEALYIAGMSSLYLSEGKGKQSPPKSPPETALEYTPEKLRQGARMYLSRLVKEYPESDFRKEAEASLRALGGADEVSNEQ